MQSLMKTAAALTALTLPMSALADQHMGEEDEQSKWKKMRSEAVSASEILTGDVTNLLNPVGAVDDLILTEDTKEVAYILYDVPFPYRFYGSDDGFVSFDNVALEHGGLGSINARFDDEAAARAPEELRLTASQVDHRAVSRLMGEEVIFKNDAACSLTDLLIHPKSGKITHFVVEMNPDAIFADQPRAIPADMVSIRKNGVMEASLTVDKARAMNEYEAAML